ncbi:ash family protein [Pluralibacter gergoviae]|nr:ash family protein [Pluralibacter gergoviae]
MIAVQSKALSLAGMGTRHPAWLKSPRREASVTKMVIKVLWKSQYQLWSKPPRLGNRKHEFLESIKKGLPKIANPVYGYSAPAKSGAGIGVPVITEATHDAPSVFFCVVSSVHPFFSVPGIILGARRIMVGWVGASSGAPVSFVSGYANPAQSTTSEIGVSGGGLNHTKEAAKWLLPSPKIRNLSGLSQQFAAICRQLPHKSTISPHRQSVKHVAHWLGITSAFLPAACWFVRWRYEPRNHLRTGRRTRAPG